METNVNESWNLTGTRRLKDHLVKFFLLKLNFLTQDPSRGVTMILLPLETDNGCGNPVVSLLNSVYQTVVAMCQCSFLFKHCITLGRNPGSVAWSPKFLMTWAVASLQPHFLPFYFSLWSTSNQLLQCPEKGCYVISYFP